MTSHKFVLALAAPAMLLSACVHAPAADVVVVEPTPAPAAAAAGQAAMAMPQDRNALLWPRETRAVAFQMLDQFPQLAQARTIPAGENPYPLPAGDPLDLGDYDLDAFMASQQTAAIVVVHDGAVVFERYGLGFDATKRYTSFSVAKSLVSTLVGAAILDGDIGSVNDPMTQYIPALAGSAYDGVTIRDVLTMRSGIAWNEDYRDPNSDSARFEWYTAPDGSDPVVDYMRRLERENEPGTRFHYVSGDTQLLGVLLRQATGKSLSEYLSEKIWQPFGMEQDASWILREYGTEMAACCVQASTRDMARFGLFVLGDGIAGGERVVPEGWFAEATSPIVSLSQGRAGYGYQWWTRPNGVFMASGIFGQSIFVDPARKLVIALNSNWVTPTDAQSGRDEEAFYAAVQAAIDARTR